MGERLGRDALFLQRLAVLAVLLGVLVVARFQHAVHLRCFRDLIRAADVILVKVGDDEQVKALDAARADGRGHVLAVAVFRPRR